MNGKWTLALLALAGCADVIGADFGGKTLDAGGMDVGGSSGSPGGSSSQAGSAGTGFDGSVVINEVCATSEQPFIELFNAGSTAVELSDYRIVNGRGGPVLSDRRSLSGSLAPGAFYVSADDCDQNYCTLTFDTTGDTLEIRERGNGNVLDSVQFPGADEPGESFARVPNATGNFVASAPTPGQENQPATP